MEGGDVDGGGGLGSERDLDDGAPPLMIVAEEALKTIEKHFIEVGEGGVWTVSSAKPDFGVHPLRDGNSSTFWQSDGVLPHRITIQFPRLVVVDCVAILLSYAMDESYTPSRLSILAGTHPGDLEEVWNDTTIMPNGWVLIPLTAPTAGVVGVGTREHVGAGTAGVDGLLNEDVIESSSPTFTPWVSGVHRLFTEEIRGGPGGSGSRPSARGAPTSMGDHNTHAPPAEELQRVWCTSLHITIHENHQNGRDTHVRGVRLLAEQPQPVYTTSPFTTSLVFR